MTLLRNPALAWELGQRGHRRLGRIFTESACIDGYRALLHTMIERGTAPPAVTGVGVAA